MIRTSREVVTIPPRSWAFITGTSLGVGFLLLSGLIELLASGFRGDCFGSETECLAAAQAQAARSPVFFAVVGLLIVLATVAVAAGGRRLPALLLVVAVAGLLLNQVANSDPDAFSWVPHQLSMLSPGIVLLALASGAQLVEQFIRARLARANV